MQFLQSACLSPRGGLDIPRSPGSGWIWLMRIGFPELEAGAISENCWSIGGDHAELVHELTGNTSDTLAKAPS